MGFLPDLDENGLIIRRVRKSKGPGKRRRRKKKKRDNRGHSQPLTKSDYHRYIQSKAWTRRRRQYYARNPNACKICGSREGLQLHHVTYERLGKELDSDLVPLCEDHHRSFHAIIGGSAPDMTTETHLFIAAAKFDDEAATVMRHAAA